MGFVYVSEYQPDEHWNVAAGEDSKEREVQSGRVKREEEAYYPELAAVPDDPKDPWEEEPDYDDSLTSQIFVDSEQRKVSTEVNDLSNISKSPVMNVVHYGPETSFGSDVSSSKMQSSALSSNDGHEPAAEVLNKAPTMHGLELVLQQLSTGGGGGAHDPDLLALLLRNPQLVSQLTSGQAFTPTSITNHPGVFMQPLDPLKQLSSGGNNGAGLSVPAGDLGQERLIPSNNSKALGIPLQPGRSVSSVDQTVGITRLLFFGPFIFIYHLISVCHPHLFWFTLYCTFLLDSRQGIRFSIALCADTKSHVCSDSRLVVSVSQSYVQIEALLTFYCFLLHVRYDRNSSCVVCSFVEYLVNSSATNSNTAVASRSAAILCMSCKA